MKQYSKNIYRTALRNRGSLLGAILIIAIGIFVYASMFDTLRNLQNQILHYYDEYALADVFAEVQGISPRQLEDLENIPGIAKASGRLSGDLRILNDRQEEIVTVHLMSYNEEETVNRIRLTPAIHAYSTDSTAAPRNAGAANADGAGIYIGKRMSEIYGFLPGEKMTLLSRGSSRDYAYAGICDAPDYIYSVPPGGAYVPDGEVYDIACVSLSEAEGLLGKKNFRNELGFLLEGGFCYEDVRYELQNALEPYGLVSMSSREKQTSFDMVRGEMNELISMGVILPAIFMLISVFMTYVVHKKQIEKEHALIGTMKAFGMTDREMIRAYLAEGALIGLLGALLGGLPAGLLGRFMFDLYCDFFSLSDTVYHTYPASRLQGLLIAVATGMLAALVSVRKITAVTPALAMRAQPPRVSRHSALLTQKTAGLDIFRKLIARTMSRNPFRGMLLVLAVAFPFSLLPALLSFPDLADTMFVDQFDKIQVFDLELSLDHWQDPLDVVRSAEGLPHVQLSEAAAVTTARIEYRGHTEYSGFFALPQDSGLWKIRDTRKHFYTPPSDGIILNSRIASKLGAAPGDIVSVSLPGLCPVKADLRIVSVISEGFGSGCYLAMDSLKSYFPVADCANTLLLRIDPGTLDYVKSRLRNAGSVSWMVDAGKTVESYRDMMNSMTSMINLFAVFSVAAGIVLICCISMINIRERKTELGTILILGGTRREIGKMLLEEQLVYYLGGVLLGIPGSKGICRLLETIIVSESYAMTITIGRLQYAETFVICLVITAAAWIAETRYLRKIDLPSLLSERNG